MMSNEELKKLMEKYFRGHLWLLLKGNDEKELCEKVMANLEEVEKLLRENGVGDERLKKILDKADTLMSTPAGELDWPALQILAEVLVGKGATVSLYKRKD